MDDGIKKDRWWYALCAWGHDLDDGEDGQVSGVFWTKTRDMDRDGEITRERVDVRGMDVRMKRPNERLKERSCEVHSSGPRETRNRARTKETSGNEHHARESVSEQVGGGITKE